MTTKLSPAQRQQIEQTGYGIVPAENVGEKKKRYWTPSGEEIWASANDRECIITNASGKKRTAIRDANLDNGWLTAPPEKIKPQCPHCRRWHDTKAQITACDAKTAKFNARFMKLARKEVKQEAPQEDARITNLEAKVDKLTALLEKLVRKEA